MILVILTGLRSNSVRPASILETSSKSLIKSANHFDWRCTRNKLYFCFDTYYGIQKAHFHDATRLGGLSIIISPS